MSRPEQLRAQLEAIRAQAVAIVATVDAVVGPPVDDQCCEKPAPKTVETYTSRTVYCDNCKQVLTASSVGPEGGEKHA